MHQSSRLALASVWLLLGYARSCSNFAMENDYRLSARTEDLGDVPHAFTLVTMPAGATPAVRSPLYGYIAFTMDVPGMALNETGIKAGLNTRGLSCDKQTLINSAYANASSTLDNIDASLICQWALEGFASVDEVLAALPRVNFVTTTNKDFENGHWVLRDAAGRGVVIEFDGGRLSAFEDHNDRGRTGFGVMTNEPRFPWQLEAVRHLQWKRDRLRSAIAMPGGWYPDDRFQRLWLVKSAMPTPADYEEAIAQTVTALNTVTVPMGDQIGTDSGSSSHEGGGSDRTHWAVVYDHLGPTVYWRTQRNQNLQRVRLADARLARGEASARLPTESPKLAFFNDAAGALAPASSPPRVAV